MIHFFKKLIHPILLQGTKFFDKCKIHIINRNAVKDIPEPVIFVVNHSNGHDFPVVAQCIKNISIF